MTLYPPIGFIGTGTIAVALATAFCQEEQRPYPILLSPRNADKAAQLRSAFPDRVQVCRSMQEVVDGAAWVFLTILPQVGEEVCRSLHFRPEQKVINLMTDINLPQIREWIGPTAILAHLVPLSFIAVRRGPIILYPPLPEVVNLLEPIGDVVTVDDRYHAAVLAAITAYVASYFTLVQQMVDWAVSFGVPVEQAKDYITRMLVALAGQGMDASPERLRELAEEMTPGGINWMVKEYIQSKDGFRLWTDGMPEVMARLTKNIPHTLW